MEHAGGNVMIYTQPKVADGVTIIHRRLSYVAANPLNR